jgi:hypothetical protein
VVISAQCQENPLELQIRVVNYGTRAITDVTFVDVVAESHDLKLWPTTGPFPPVAAPGWSVVVRVQPRGLWPRASLLYLSREEKAVMYTPCLCFDNTK